MDDEDPADGGAEGARDAAPLLEAQEDPLAGGAADEGAVGAVRLEERDVRADRRLVERGAAIAQRGDDGRDQRAVPEFGQHGADASARPRASGVAPLGSGIG